MVKRNIKEFNINNSGIDKINKIEIKNLYYKYPGNNSNVLNGINMTYVYLFCVNHWPLLLYFLKARCHSFHARIKNKIPAGIVAREINTF